MAYYREQKTDAPFNESVQKGGDSGELYPC